MEPSPAPEILYININGEQWSINARLFQKNYAGHVTFTACLFILSNIRFAEQGFYNLMSHSSVAISRVGHLLIMLAYGM